MLLIDYSFKMSSVAFLSTLVLLAMTSLTSTYGLVVLPYLTPLVNFI